MADAFFGLPSTSRFPDCIFEVGVSPGVSIIIGKRFLEEFGKLLAFLLEDPEFGAVQS